MDNCKIFILNRKYESNQLAICSNSHEGPITFTLPPGSYSVHIPLLIFVISVSYFLVFFSCWVLLVHSFNCLFLMYVWKCRDYHTNIYPFTRLWILIWKKNLHWKSWHLDIFKRMSTSINVSSKFSSGFLVYWLLSRDIYVISLMEYIVEDEIMLKMAPFVTNWCLQKQQEATG